MGVKCYKNDKKICKNKKVNKNKIILGNILLCFVYWIKDYNLNKIFVNMI